MTENYYCYVITGTKFHPAPGTSSSSIAPSYTHAGETLHPCDAGRYTGPGLGVCGGKAIFHYYAIAYTGLWFTRFSSLWFTRCSRFAQDRLTYFVSRIRGYLALIFGISELGAPMRRWYL
jgi:hypothetical protein